MGVVLDGKAVELSPAVKRHLGLDDAQSWVVLSESNLFIRPGIGASAELRSRARWQAGHHVFRALNAETTMSVNARICSPARSISSAYR